MGRGGVRRGAVAEDKPILLSVGYSACHWCHVMAHESFEDDEVAAVMNDRFVNVKVDREERPDVDAIYMDAVQALTGRGGWPMTVFLTPDGRPFFGGTYFPKDDRQGMPGFLRVMDAIEDVWRNRRDDVFDQAEQLTTAMAGSTLRDQLAAAGPATLSPGGARPGRGRARRELRRAARRVRRGARSSRPSMAIDFLLRRYVRTDGPRRSTMVTTTLDAMAAGGIYDHVGGGFARYSTDAHWLVPHFEKMLYDQALLVGAYLRALPRHRRRRGTGASSRRRSPTCCATSATPTAASSPPRTPTAKGIEGKFYLWSLEELTEVCGDAAPEVIRAFGVTAGGQLPRPAHRLLGQHPAPRRPHRGPVTDAITEALGRLFDAAGDAGPARPRRQGAARLERAVPPVARRGRGRVRPARLDGRGRAANAAFLRRGAAPRRRPAAALVAREQRRRGTSRSPRTTPRCSRRT